MEGSASTPPFNSLEAMPNTVLWTSVQALQIPDLFGLWTWGGRLQVLFFAGGGENQC